MASKRCVYCNCLSHTSDKCNSNMNGRRKFLDGMWNCMIRAECPDFNTFPINELKYIATKYALYEKAVWSNDHMGQQFNREYLRRPISLTISKNRLVRALVDRWTGFADMRKMLHSQPEDVDCPICYEKLFNYRWSFRTSSWMKEYEYINDPCHENPVAMNRCKHMFCGRCWDGHITRNSKYDDRIGQAYVDCPMCRDHVYIGEVSLRRGDAYIGDFTTV